MVAIEIDQEALHLIKKLDLVLTINLNSAVVLVEVVVDLEVKAVKVDLEAKVAKVDVNLNLVKVDVKEDGLLNLVKDELEVVKVVVVLMVLVKDELEVLGVVVVVDLAEVVVLNKCQ